MEKGLCLINDDNTTKLRSEKHLLALTKATMGVPPEKHSQDAVDMQDEIENHISALIEAVEKDIHQVRICKISRRNNITLQDNNRRQEIKEASTIQNSASHAI